MQLISTGTPSIPAPTQHEVDVYAKRARDIELQIADWIQVAAEHLKEAVRARHHRDELRQKYDQYFDEHGALRFITTLLIGFILVGIYCLDVFLVRPPVEFIVGTYLGETASKIAVLAIPLAIMALEIWTGFQLHEAVEAWRRDETDHEPVVKRAILAGICALAIPVAIVVTYLASDFTGGLPLLIIFQLALALVAHLGLLAGAHIIMEHASWAIVRLRHWRWNRKAINEERDASRALAQAERKAMDLRKLLDRAARHGVELSLGAIPKQVRDFLEEHFPGEFDVLPQASNGMAIAAGRRSVGNYEVPLVPPVIMLPSTAGAQKQGPGDFIPG